MPLSPKMFNQPLMIESNYLNSMIALNVESLDKKIEVLDKNALTWKQKRSIGKNISVISVIGPLSQRSDFWEWYYGGTSYDQIRQNFQAALEDSDVETIIFEIDSPGGAVAGVFDLTDEIYAARGKKRIVAMINESTYSAAYAIASAADEIYIPRTGGAGSIGVRALHADLSKWEAKIGVKYTPIFAGARKNDFSPHEPLSEESYLIVKKEVDAIYDIFIDTTERNRGIDAEIIRKMEAGIYQGQKAVDIGLADEIKTMTEVLNNIGGKRMSKSLTEAIQNVIKDAKPKELAKSMDEIGYVEKEGMMSEADHIKAMESKSTEFDTKLAENTAVAKAEGKEEGREEAQKETIAVLELCSIASKEKLGLKMVSDGISRDEAKKQIFAAQTPQQNINSTVNSMHTGEKNPLIADAERRAKEARA